MNKEFINPPETNLTARQNSLYSLMKNEVRSPYHRDYTRILHSNAYRRLKHKTQVFYNIDNDHVCTRIEHVNHVDSVSYSIALGLGLNVELTKAIASGHDLGHAPFGHEGEVVLDERLKKELSSGYLMNNYADFNLSTGSKDKIFWHERNGLRFVDNIELLPDPKGICRNLNLTYAVRDGIISHCGEVDENGLIPRREYIDLYDFKRPGEYAPYTWEGCVVKISDKIAYLGRDIEDAIALGFIDDEAQEELRSLAKKYVAYDTLNTTGLMHTLIGDIIDNSSPDKGICFSRDKLGLINDVKAYNYKYIYKSSKFDVYTSYVRLVLNSIFDTLIKYYDGRNTFSAIEQCCGRDYVQLSRVFSDWLSKYCEKGIVKTDDDKYENYKIYGDLSDRNDYVWAVADFISGMTDPFAISIFNELISFHKNM